MNTADMTLHPDWTESPLVRHAFTLAGDGAPVLDVLEQLHSMLLRLDDIGVNAAELAAAWTPDTSTENRVAVRRYLKNQGMQDGLIDTLVDGTGIEDGEVGSVYRCHPRFDAIVAYRRDGIPVKDIAHEFGVSETFVYRCAAEAERDGGYRARATTQERWTDDNIVDWDHYLEVARYVLATGTSNGHNLHKATGHTRRMCQHVLNRMRADEVIPPPNLPKPKPAPSGRGKGRPNNDDVYRSRVLHALADDLKPAEIMRAIPGTNKAMIARIRGAA
jgi:hypothetical protein